MGDYGETGNSGETEGAADFENIELYPSSFIDPVGLSQ
jgi:hypothetical protein